jgi:hypothetical protein
MPTPIGPRLVTIPTITPAEASTGPEAPAAPAMTPARALTCDEPELVSRAETSVGARAALAMKSTWNPGADSARATGAEGGPGYAGPMPARPLSPVEQKVAQKVDEGLRYANQHACDLIVGGALKYTASKLPVNPTAGSLASKAIAGAICNQPDRPVDNGGAHGSAGAPTPGAVR